MMTKIYNPPMLQNLPVSADPETVKRLRAAFVYDGELITGSYKEIEKRLLEQMNECFRPAAKTK